MNTLLLSTTKKSLTHASEILAKGGLVAFPTETVYGLGADAYNEKAVSRVFTVKGRPSANPLIVHVKDLGMASRLAIFDEVSSHLARVFWPGPLTLILPKKETSNIPENVTANSGYIAIRVPANPIIQQLIELLGKPIVGPSANTSGKMSSTSPAHVLSDFNGKIDAVINGDDCPMGLESTILMYEHPSLQILRLGIISEEMISTKLSELKVETSLEGNKVPSPGSKFRHYSPDNPIRINCHEKRDDEVLIGFGETIEANLNLSEKGEFQEAAKNLYKLLREADQMVESTDLKGIAVAPVPDLGLGKSINDRLERASREY